MLYHIFMSKFCYFVLYPFHRLGEINHRIWYKFALPSKFASCGKNVDLSTDFIVSGEKNISIGDNVSFGPGCLVYSTMAKLCIGNDVVFGPRVTIITGDHDFSVVGQKIDQVTDASKNKKCDKDVVFEGDNWVGANVTVLKGVTVGRGAVIGAGSVVTKSIPRYAVVAGNPATVIKMRFSPEEIQSHERAISQNQNNQSIGKDK
jgi:acetyltransferase-like isoleucine patch superfamily enzyme